MRFGALPDAEHSHVQHSTTVTPALSRRDVMMQMFAMTLYGATITGSGCASRDVSLPLKQTVSTRETLPPNFTELSEGKSIMGKPFLLQVQTPTGKKTLQVEFVSSTRITVDDETFTLSEINALGQRCTAEEMVPLINVPVREAVKDVSAHEGILLHGENGHVHLSDFEFRRLTSELSNADPKGTMHTVSGLWVEYKIVTPPVMGISVPIEGNGICDVTLERATPPKRALAQK